MVAVEIGKGNGIGELRRVGFLMRKGIVGDGRRWQLHVEEGGKGLQGVAVVGWEKAFDFGKSIHSSVVKLGFELYLVVGNALIDMYSKVGNMESARNVFAIGFEGRNVVSYTSLIDGYVEKDQIEKALDVYLELRRWGIEPNEFTFSSLIKACTDQAAIEQGTQLHSQVVKFNFDKDPSVSSALVDTYGKCGLLDHSIQVFAEIEYPTKIVWNLLEGLKKLKNLSIACHSSQMLLDGVLFLGLASCRATERGKLAAEQLMRLEPENSGAYVLLLIIYAEMGRYKEC
ncbi:Pentatricopeptide repeat-containing protein [Camellia lanceoleosa]|uniref:Pentatricopeptide repeat-containing protein n=1 Tax=Camellia lanceoleosa TaxID=1840588 RepID=A0ACC0HK69_9ERIC|nr:Pentatricopeptide repeat-containing protein [Camellia lanceoleosa]